MMFKKKIKDVPSFYSEKRSTTYLVVVVTIISRSKLKKGEKEKIPFRSTSEQSVTNISV